MAKVIVSEFLTLDGVAEAPEKWSLEFWNDDLAAFKLQELQNADALLLGRATYDIFAGSWPSRSGDPYSDRINAIPKYVASKSGNDLAWNNSTSLSENLVEEVERIKKSASGDILVFGSLSFAEELRKANLVDAYQLLIYPVLRGCGKRLFPQGVEGTLKLESLRAFGEAVLVTYEA
ncbi:dihydrofolate reductase [Ensifer sp. ENS02]|uniref:dihydrofolate reductase family protein n=1 Tax=Ensifer sp. ENS02 TaxID=2769290 RepID=UPI00177CC19A|nr:dihydrofolate reductase family protein [Ensifer sp. ENS02]MBD9524720.1 dihydrofolate reductase [Ensifer sp. ENS02]